MTDLLEKIKLYEDNYNRLVTLISSPDISSDPEKLKEYGKKISEIEDIIHIAKPYKETLRAISDTQEMIKEEEDAEMRQYLEEELKKSLTICQNYEKKIMVFLTPKDPNDNKNIIVEMRAGAGGDEAAIFAGNLYRMYTMYAESKKWAHKVLSSNTLGIGGFKEIIFEIIGKGAFGIMKYESGVHRVQRIPVTESGGRIHTSTATVAVLPEAEDVEVELDMNDLRIDVFRSSGPGGQSVNTTDSAVRITHIPTGITISCQDEKSQLQNKERALKILRARLLEIEQQKQSDEQTKNRKMQIGTGDRSERIRTYNYPQNRVTDHRINLTLYKLTEILEGNLDELIEALKDEDEQKKLQQVGA
jgi:peptide chain release factor 1